MFRFLFRFAGLVLIALSFLFVVYDGTRSIADQTIYISRVGPTWVNIHPSSLLAFEPALKTLAGAWVWNDVIQPYFLQQPTALVLGIIGALLVLLGSKKKSRTGYLLIGLILASTYTERASFGVTLALDHAAIGREWVVVPDDGSQIRLALNY